MAKGKVQIDITAKDQASKKLKGVGDQGQRLKDTMKKVGIAAAVAAAAVSAALGKMLYDWTKAGDEIAKTAKRMGWSTEAVSEMAYAARISGAELKDVETATKRLSKAVVDASAGLATYVRAFDRIGLSAEDLLGLSPEEQFWAVAQALAGIDDQAIRTATAMDLFGRSGTNLFPLLEEGAEGIAELRDRAREMGIVFDEEAAANAEKLNDAMTDMKAAVDGLKYAVAEQLAPALTDLIQNTIVPAIHDLRNFLKENDNLVQAFIALANLALNVAAAIGRVVQALLDLGEWLGKHKALWDILSHISPAIFWPREMQEKLFGPKTSGPGLLPGLEEQYGAQARLLMAQGATSNVNVTVNSQIMTDEALREIWKQLEPYMQESQRRTTFPHVNTAGYYQGSSAR